MPHSRTPTASRRTRGNRRRATRFARDVCDGWNSSGSYNSRPPPSGAAPALTWLQDTSRSRRGVIALFALVSVLAAGRLALDVAFGLRADYFSGARSASDTPSFSAVDDRVSTAALVRNWLGDLPGTFRVRWFGYLSISESADYTF